MPGMQQLPLQQLRRLPEGRLRHYTDWPEVGLPNICPPQTKPRLQKRTHQRCCMTQQEQLLKTLVHHTTRHHPTGKSAGNHCHGDVVC